MTASHFALLALKIIGLWTLASIIFGTLVCWLIFRGKMDSHRRDDRAGSGDPVVLRSSGERGFNINHGDVL